MSQLLLGLQRILTKELGSSVFEGLAAEELTAIAFAPEIAIPFLIGGIALSGSALGRINRLIQDNATGNELNEQHLHDIRNGRNMINRNVERNFGIRDPEPIETEPLLGPSTGRPVLMRPSLRTRRSTRSMPGQSTRLSMSRNSRRRPLPSPATCPLI